jgi:D-alanyl-lipoteichoic acid acyltransferase DltB (MBOAT superfamily)
MQFNSFLFLVFFVITYTVYLFCSQKWQNRILLLASYIFYGTWDYRFLFLLLFSTVANYIAGHKIKSSVPEKKRKTWLWVSVVLNIGILGFFKYYNFFVDALADLILWCGWGNHTFALRIILPVGISFYTFKTISYVIDIYRNKLSPAESLVDFSLYVAFFPQLIAGPIERATSLLPQICSKRSLTTTLFTSSAYLFLFGLFEKTVVADNLAVLVDTVYSGRAIDGFSVVIANYAFAFQIFADFDGYSNMAKGLAGLMGFRLIDNFNAPYFSENPSEFWSRWHISLSSWLRDYLYIPLGGNRGGLARTARNLFITMILGGLWHGASWMFILWGAFHGLLLVAYLPLHGKLIKLPLVFRRLMLFHLVCFGWMLFRAENFEQFNYLIWQIFSNFHYTLDTDQTLLLKKFLFYTTIPIIYQYLQYSKKRLCPVFDWPVAMRAIFYVLLFYMIVIFGFNNAQSFIYSQF